MAKQITKWMTGAAFAAVAFTAGLARAETTFTFEVPLNDPKVMEALPPEVRAAIQEALKKAPASSEAASTAQDKGQAPTATAPDAQPAAVDLDALTHAIVVEDPNAQDIILQWI